MTAHLRIKRFEATACSRAFMSISVQDGPAMTWGHVYLGGVRFGSFTVHMTNPAFGGLHNVLGVMPSDEVEKFLQYVLGPIDFARPALQVTA